MIKMKRYFVILAAVLMIWALTGCGHVKNANELYDYAKETYGDCEVLEKESHGKRRSDAYTTIVCKDEQYGFTYYVTSYMHAENLDGATLGHTPRIKSDFESVYAQFIYDTNKDRIDAIGREYNTDFMLINDWLIKYYGTGNEPERIVDTLGVVLAYDSTSAGKAAVAIGELYNATDTRAYFTTDRKSYDIPQIMSQPFDAKDKNDRLGDLKLDDLKWHSIEEKTILSYLEKARTYDETAKYVGQHTGGFSETGASLDDVIEYGEHKGACSNFE